jgi:hypothetical protein
MKIILNRLNTNSNQISFKRYDINNFKYPISHKYSFLKYEELMNIKI